MTMELMTTVVGIGAVVAHAPSNWLLLPIVLNAFCALVLGFVALVTPESDKQPTFNATMAFFFVANGISALASVLVFVGVV